MTMNKQAYRSLRDGGHRHFRKESTFVDYGKGSPGYNWEVRVLMNGRRIARAFGPNVHGVHIGEFADRDAVELCRSISDGPVSQSVVRRLLRPSVAERHAI